MFDDTPLLLVRDDATLREVAERLARSKVIGIDTESNSFYAFQERVCLLQLSDDEGDIIIDPLTCKDFSPLAEVMASRDIVKVLHGADYDIVSLKRDYGFVFHNVFDTLLASQFLGFPKVGLGDLITRFFGYEVDKAWQRHDWARRPLLPDHIDYARGDTHFLQALREILEIRLKNSGRYAAFKEECEIVSKREWTGKKDDPADFYRVRGSQDLDTAELYVLRALFRYREDEARKVDRPVFKVIPDDVLYSVAKAQPETEAELDRALSGKEGLKRRYGRGLVAAVIAGQDDDSDLPEKSSSKHERPKRGKGPRPRLKGRAAERTLTELKNWRNKLTDRDATLSAHNTISNGVLKQIASMRPRTIDELAGLSDVRKWQVKEFGEELLVLLDQIEATDED